MKDPLTRKCSSPGALALNAGARLRVATLGSLRSAWTFFAIPAIAFCVAAPARAVDLAVDDQHPNGDNSPYTISSGSFTYGSVFVGAISHGRLNHLDGSVTATFVSVGHEPGSAGDYILGNASLAVPFPNAVLSTGTLVVGRRGNGTFSHVRGGTVTISGALRIADDVGVNGTYELFAGTVSAADEYIGVYNTGSFRQVAGTNIVSNTLQLGVNSGSGFLGRGSYTLEGGVLQTGRVAKGAGLATFNFKGGTLQARTDSAIFMQGLTNAYVEPGGAKIDSNGHNITIAQPLSAGLNGNGGLTKLGNGTLTLTNTTAAHSFGGGVNLNGGVLSVSSNAALANASNPLNFNGGILQVTGTAISNFNAHPVNTTTFNGGLDIAAAGHTFSVPGGLSGSNLTKSGPGILTLGGANSFTGITSVGGGTLNFSPGATFSSTATSVATGAAFDPTALPSATLAIGSGQSLGGDGSVSGAVAIQGGGNLAPGSSVGTITVGSLTLASGSPAAALSYEFNGAPPTVTNDFANVTGALTINGGSVYLYIENTTSPFNQPGSYDLIGYGTLAGSAVDPVTHSVAMSVANPVQGFSYTFSDDPARKRIVLTIAQTPQAPQFTSADHASFQIGVAGSFTVTTTGFPTPTITASPAPPPPAGVTFTDNGDGTATFSGTPAPGTAGAYQFTLTATNTLGSATQTFTLSVNEPPAITSANATTFKVGEAGTFTVTATGYPPPSFSVSGTLPAGVTFNTSTGVLSGTPQVGSAGSYSIIFTASNGVGSNATQSFTLTVLAAAPSLDLQAGSDTGSSNTDNITNAAAISFDVGSTENAHVIELYRDGTLVDSETSSGGTVVLTDTPDEGSYTYTARQKNSAGVYSDYSSSLNVAVDRTGPSVSAVTRVDANPTSASSIRYSVVFSQPVTGVDTTDFVVTSSGVSGASVTGVSGASPGTTYQVTVSTGSGDGTLRLDVADDDSITDVAGNALGGSGAANGNFGTGAVYTVDRTHPAVSSIARASVDPTAPNQTVSYTVTFGESVTGVDPADFNLSVTNLSGASITSVSGSAATYTVSVNTGTGSPGATGTLRLNLTDNNSIIDLAGNPLGGPAIGDGNFTTGEVYTVVVPPAPTLGNYPNTTISLSEDATITPDAAPTDTTSINVSSYPSFNGTLTADPGTGAVRVTNASLSGTYVITVKAFGTSIATKTFTLTVDSGTTCTGPSFFSGGANLNVASFPDSVAVGDFNGDGNHDLANGNRGSGTVSISLGDGAGGFTAAPAATVGPSPSAVAVGDFNNDGKQDLAVANNNTTFADTANAYVAIRLGDGTGAFTAAGNIGVGSGPHSVALADFNNDGKLDFVTGNIAGNSISLRLGNGSGGSAGGVDFSAGQAPYSVAVGDFNNDGKQDVAAAAVNSNLVSVFFGNGAGSFAFKNTFFVSAPRAIAVGDFNGDGNDDYAAASPLGTVYIRLGDGTGDFSNAPNVNVSGQPGSVAVADFNNDGKQDLAVGRRTGGNVAIYFGNGSGGFGSLILVGAGSTPQAVAIGDLNHDGKQDVAVANSGSNLVTTALGGCNAAPIISVATGLYALPGEPSANRQIATVTDDGGNGSVVVRVNGSTSATVNGVTVSNIVNSNGTITADIVAASDASTVNFTLQASDGVSTSTATLNVRTDIVAPSVTIEQASGQSDPTNSLPIRFTVVFSEAVTGFEAGDVSLSGTGATVATVAGSGTTYEVSVNKTADGAVTATIPADSATDASGNGNAASTSADNSVTLDATPPAVTSITLSNGSPTRQSSVAFTVNFNESVTGVDASDFALTTSGVTGASVTGVSGSGSSYAVTVSTGTGSGTIRLDVVDDDSLIDHAGNPLGGTGNGNGNFTTGPSYTIDKTSPTVMINQASGQAEVTVTSPVNFTAIFSEPVTDFDGGDVSLGGTAMPSTATVTDSGDHMTFNVAVSGMTATGTVTASVPAGVVHDGVGNGNTASTSSAPPNDNTVFYGGVAAGGYEVNSTSDADADDGVCAPAAFGNGCTLREAVQAANSDGLNSTITFDATVFATTQTITLLRGELVAANNGSFTMQGAGATRLIVSGGNASRVFRIASGASTAIGGLTVTGGNGTGGGESIRSGGGINVGGALTLNDCAVTSNQASADSSNAGRGGGIFIESSGSLTIVRSIINGNVSSGNGSAGGGICNTGNLSVLNCTLTGNSATLGGGIRQVSGFGNSVSVTNSTISGNAAGRGGGIDYQAGAAVNVSNCIITGNLRTFNNPQSDVSDAGQFTSYVSGGYNIVGTGNATGRFNATGDRVGIDPRLGPLAGNGGTTATFSLLPGSPALDRGNNGALTTDQRGLARPADGDGNGAVAVDIGAYEQQTAQPVDLAISQSASPDPVTAGQPLTYTLTVTNNGTGDLTGVRADFVLPAATTYSSNTGNSNFSGNYDSGSNTVRFTGGNLNAGSSATLTVVVTPTTSAAVTSNGSSVTVDPADVLAESDESNNNAATITTTVTPSADLELTNSDAPDPVTAGADITYTIRLTNAGPTEAADVTVSDTLPANTTFVSFSAPDGWSATTPAIGGSGSVTASSASLPATATAEFTLVVKVSPATASGSVIEDTASVSSTTSDPDGSDNSATASTTVNTSADVSVALSDSPDPVAAGANLTYTITVANAGSSDAQNVQLTDTVPAGTRFVSLQQSSGSAFSCTTPAIGATGTVTCSSATIGAASNAVFQLVVRVDPNAANGATITNTASVSSDTSDPASANNSTTKTTTVTREADLALTITDAPDPVVPGGNITYTIDFVNNGAGAASNASVTNAIPDGTSFVSAGVLSGSDWTITAPAPGATNDNIVFTKSSVAPAETARFEVVVQVAGDTTAGTTITDSASATSGTTDPSSANNSVTTETTVGKAAAAVALSSSSNPSTYGDAVTFTASVTPSAPSTGKPAGTVTFKDGTTMLGSSPLNSSGVATLTVPSFTAGTHTITAEYSGDANFNSATSASLSQVVNKAGTSLAVTSSNNPSESGESVTFTADVTSAAGTPTGTAQFKIDGANAGEPVTLDANGRATYTTSSLTAGSHTVSAEYSGEANFEASTGTLSGGQVAKAQPSPSPSASPSPTASPSPSPSPSASPSRSLNISTRGRVGTGERALIAGTIITGNAAKKVIFRAIGPSLADDDIVEPLTDPILELYGPNGSLITTNDDWKDGGQQAEIEASGVKPEDDRESAIIATLMPNSYTAIVRGKANGEGVALAEIYDLDRAADSQLANISTRAFVQTEENVVIGGFLLGGSNETTDVVIRALGPSLRDSGVAGFLADPTLELRDGNGALIRSNDDWAQDPEAAMITANGLQPDESVESAIAISLPPGDYTAIVAGKNNTFGVGLVEIYNLQ